MKKKLLSLFMACAMILALAVPAFAASPYFEHSEGAVSADLSQEVTITTRTFVPTVKLTLPTLTEPSIVLNPYKISFTGEDDLLLNGYAVADDDEQGKQVISPVYTIKNQTNVKLNYTVAVTGTVEGGVVFSNDPVSLTEKTKKAHVALMVSNRGVGVASLDNADGTAQKIEGFGARAAGNGVPAIAALTKDDIETMWLKTTEVKSSVPKSLEPGNVTGGENYVAFQFKGDLTRLATPNAWTAEDKIGAVITFTFTPESAQDFAFKGASNATELSLGTVEVGTTPAAPSAVVINTTNFNNYNDYKVNATSQDAAKWDIFVKPSNPDILKVQKTVAASGSPAATTWEIVMDAAKVKAAYPTKADGSAHDSTAEAFHDTMVLSFVDEDNIPRTVSVPFTFSVTAN